MSNLESQENELFSLQSIFDEKEFFIDAGSTPPSGRMVAEVRLPNEFYVTAVKSEQPGAALLVEKFQVSHLPPITLFFELPDTYPLETCPEFFLSCNWLSLQQMSALCRQLQHLWEVNMDAILYIWMQFLQEEALDFLDISQCLDVSELLTFDMKDNFRHRENYSDDCDGDTDPSLCTDELPLTSDSFKSIDVRAFNELSNGETLIKALKDYNESKIESIFYTTIQDCNVCLLRKPGSEFLKFGICKHFYCKDCVKGYIEELIKDGRVKMLKCLHGECSTHLDGSTVKSLVEPDVYERYDRLLLSTTLEGMSDITYCPRLDCQCPCIVDTCGHMASCSACGFVFCPLCKMTYHGIETCSLKFKLDCREKIYEEYINGDSSIRKAIKKQYGKRFIQTIIEDSLSESWKKSNSKNCPKCDVSIEKTEGCNNMTCYKCGQYFCWLCLNMLGSFPYWHYNSPSSRCYNKLYPEEYIDNEFD